MADSIEPIPAWTLDEMCIATGFSRPTVSKYIDDGILPGQKFPGGQYRIPALEARAWMEGRWVPHTKTRYVPKPLPTAADMIQKKAS